MGVRAKADPYADGSGQNEHYDRFANDRSIDRYAKKHAFLINMVLKYAYELYENFIYVQVYQQQQKHLGPTHLGEEHNLQKSSH